jgi:hypothetical protein
MLYCRAIFELIESLYNLHRLEGFEAFVIYGGLANIYKCTYKGAINIKSLLNLEASL